LQFIVELLVINLGLVFVEVDRRLELNRFVLEVSLLLREFFDGGLELVDPVAGALLDGLGLVQQLPQLHHLLVDLALHALHS
jgi:hypothetical protein